MNIYKKLRKEKGLTQTELAEKFGISQTTPSKREKGLAIPEPQMLKKLSEFYGVSIDYLLGNNETTTIGKRIKELRIQYGYTQSELAEMLNVEKSNISKWESGVYEPSKDLIIKIGEIFNVSVDYLLKNNNFSKPINNLRTLRKQKGFTLKEVANKLNLAESTISLYETGNREPDHLTLCALADLYEVSVDELLGRAIEDNSKTRIKELRQNAGYTQEELASILSVDKSRISKWENNVTYPSHDIVEKICDLFNCTIDFLFCRTDNNKTNTRFQRLRVEHGYTQQQLADLLSLDRTTIGKWECGENLPSNKILQKLSKLYNCSIDYLLGNEDCPSTPIETVNPDGEIENEILSLCKNMSVENKAKLLLYAYELTRSSPQ